jgi:hypothetical protein
MHATWLTCRILLFKISLLTVCSGEVGTSADTAPRWVSHTTTRNLVSRRLLALSSLPELSARLTLPSRNSLTFCTFSRQAVCFTTPCPPTPPPQICGRTSVPGSWAPVSYPTMRKRPVKKGGRGDVVPRLTRSLFLPQTVPCIRLRDGLPVPPGSSKDRGQLTLSLGTAHVELCGVAHVQWLWKGVLFGVHSHSEGVLHGTVRRSLLRWWGSRFPFACVLVSLPNRDETVHLVGT